MNILNIELSKPFNKQTFTPTQILNDYIKNSNLNNIDVISDENMKKEILSNSIFAVCKSGTISLQVCNANVPSIII